MRSRVGVQAAVNNRCRRRRLSFPSESVKLSAAAADSPTGQCRKIAQLGKASPITIAASLPLLLLLFAERIMQKIR